MANNTPRVPMRNILKNCYFFADFTAEDMLHIEAHVSLKSYSKNDLVFLEGGQATALYYIVKGSVKVFKTAFSGKEVILHLFKTGESFAEIPVFLKLATYPASAMCLEDSELLVINGNKFQECVHLNPDLCLKMLSGLSKRIKNFNSLVEDLTLRSVESRLAKYIISLKTNCPANNIQISISKKTLAAILGTVPETLSRTFKKLEDDKLVYSTENQLTILNEEGLYQLADIPDEERSLI